jgi:hypothetical protein
MFVIYVNESFIFILYIKGFECGFFFIYVNEIFIFILYIKSWNVKSLYSQF